MNTVGACLEKVWSSSRYSHEVPCQGKSLFGGSCTFTSGAALGGVGSSKQGKKACLLSTEQA